MTTYKTSLTPLLGTKHPIIGGTMMDISKPSFVAAISSAGALGVLASAMYRDPAGFRDAVKETKDLTDQPFGVNINLFPMMEKLDNRVYLEIMLEEGLGIVETSGFAPPEELVAEMKKNGMRWMHKCVGVRYAKKAETLGADAVTVVGYENGGATGNLNVTTLVLVPATCRALGIPVIGGGGVVDGPSFLSLLALGAEGAIVGTRLMLSEECPLHDNVKKALLEASELDTDVIMRSVGFAHRVWMNEASKKAAEAEARGGGIEEIYPYVSGKAAKEMYEKGDTTVGSMSCSQAVGLIDSIKPVREIISEIVEDAGKTADRLNDLRG